MRTKATVFIFAIIMGVFMTATPLLAASTYMLEFKNSSSVPTAAADAGKPGVDGVDAFTFWFSVGSDFSRTNLELGDAVPTTGTLGWLLDSNSIVTDPTFGLVYKIGAFDQDGLYMGNPNYLQDGIIFSFDYEGTLNELVVAQLDPGNGSNLFGDVIKLRDLSQDQNDIPTVGAPVPLPSTLLLLGGGLAGLFGLKRRKQA